MSTENKDEATQDANEHQPEVGRKRKSTRQEEGNPNKVARGGTQQPAEDDIFDDEEEDDDVSFDGNDEESLIPDQEDRKKLDQMTEIEREQELHRRHEELQKKKERKKAREVLQQNQKLAEIEKEKMEKGNKWKKAKGNSEQQAEKEDTEATQKQVTAVESKVKYQSEAPKSTKSTEADGDADDSEENDLVIGGRRLRARQQTGYESSDDDSSEEEGEWNQLKKPKGNSKQRRDKESKQQFISDSEDSSSESESDNEGNETDEALLDEDEIEERRRKKELQSRELNVDDIRKITLSRPFLVSHVIEPYFANMVKDAFVRVRFKEENKGYADYHLVRILKVVRGDNPYPIGSSSSDKRVFKRLEVRMSDGKRRWFKVVDVSSQSPTKTEFADWKNKAEQLKHDVPTPLWCEEKSSFIECCKNHVYTDAEVQQMCQDNMAALRVRNAASISNLRETIVAQIEHSVNQLCSEYNISSEEINDVEHSSRLTQAEKKHIHQKAGQIQRLRERVKEIDEEETRRAQEERSKSVTTKINRMSERRNAELDKHARRQAAIKKQQEMQQEKDKQLDSQSARIEKVNNKSIDKSLENKSKGTEATSINSLSAKALSFEVSKSKRDNELGNEFDSILQDIAAKKTSSGESSARHTPGGSGGPKKITLAEYKAVKNRKT